MQLQREVVYRVALALKKRNQEERRLNDEAQKRELCSKEKCRDSSSILRRKTFVLVLPPWCHVQHWRLHEVDIHRRLKRLRWGELLELRHLRELVPTIEFEDFASLHFSTTREKADLLFLNFDRNNTSSAGGRQPLFCRVTAPEMCPLAKSVLSAEAQGKAREVFEQQKSLTARGVGEEALFFWLSGMCHVLQAREAVRPTVKRSSECLASLRLTSL